MVTFAPLALAALGEKNLLGPEPVTAALLDAGPDRGDLALLEAGRPVLARAIAASAETAWQSAQNDDVARARLLSGLTRDLKISLRSRKGAPPQKLLLAGPLASLPGAAEKLGADLGITAEPVTLPAGTPETALALGLAVRAQTPRGRINFRKGEFAFTKDVSRLRGVILKLGLAGAAVLVLALVLGIARVSALNR